MRTASLLLLCFQLNCHLVISQQQQQCSWGQPASEAIPTTSMSALVLGGTGAVGECSSRLTAGVEAVQHTASPQSSMSRPVLLLQHWHFPGPYQPTMLPPFQTSIPSPYLWAHGCLSQPVAYGRRPRQNTAWCSTPQLLHCWKGNQTTAAAMPCVSVSLLRVPCHPACRMPHYYIIISATRCCYTICQGSR